MLHQTVKPAPDNNNANIPQLPTMPSTSRSLLTSSNTINGCTAHTSSMSSSIVLLATAMIKIQASNGRSILARALLDQGSESSFISSALVKLLQLNRRKVHVPIYGLGSSQTSVAEYQVDYKVISTINPQYCFHVNSFVLPTLTQFMPSQQIQNADWPHIKSLPLADPQFATPSSIDVILGADVYSLILQGEVIHGPLGTPTAQRTSLGWILSGCTTNTSPTSVVSLHCTHNDDLNNLLRRFWELEGVSKRPLLTAEEEECERIYKATTIRDHTGRYIVHLPLKSTAEPLGASRHGATSSLVRMERLFTQNTTLYKMYKEFMEEYLRLQHMEPVPQDEEKAVPNYYLPHHAILKPTSTTTKLRVVFNASRQTTTGLSLNDVLHVGPKVQNDVTTVILRWRQYPIVFSSDIEKMYRQILVHPSHANLQRILWRSSQSTSLQSYRLRTVTYGTACAPYLACRTLLQLAEDYQAQFPVGAFIIRNNFYVDDGLFGAFNQLSALQARREVTALLQLGGFKLRKWLTNQPNLIDDIPDEDKDLPSSPRLVSDEQFKTLGIYWIPQEDIFTFQVKLPVHDQITKRYILSDISRVYDPLGWISPGTIKAKILMQKLWLSGCNWDDEPPSELTESWLTFRKDLPHLSNIYVHRWVGLTGSQLALELHGFCDASTMAYSAVVYIRVIHDMDNIQVSLVAAKAKVSPLKTVSLPRLELCGASLLAELIESVQQSLNMENVTIHTWIDSTIVLAWLKSQPSRWKVFVANRVGTIHEKLPNANWHHVPSEQNPADIASRGSLPSELKSFDLRWSGPTWLPEHSCKWPSKPSIFDIDIPEEREHILSHFEFKTIDKLELMYRYSNLDKLLRITAYCRRFILNARSVKSLRRTGHLNCDEIEFSLNHWIQAVQALSFCTEIKLLSNNKPVPTSSKLKNFIPFVDQNGLLRIGGRLKYANLTYSEKHPVILPKNSHLTTLVIDRSHITTLHGGTQLTLQHIRDTFWILNGRSKVREFIHKCLVCHRYKATARSQIMSDLPIDRVRPSKPFTNSGVDFAGPIQVTPIKGRGVKRVKAYVAVFICLATRAIHLELVMDLSSDAFIAAYKRFVGRRGHCQKMYSDNATNFVAADKELQKHVRQLLVETPSHLTHLLLKDGTEWHFIPPASPHFGGIWESGVKSLKHHLRRVVNGHIITIEEMLTVLTSIEACLNSRPLHPMSDDPDDLTVLTPGHFLIGSSLLTIPEPTTLDVHTNRLKRWQLVQNIYEHFWNRWHKEYLHHLQRRNKWFTKQKNVEVNDLVIIKDDHLPPAKWLLGRIIKVHPGRDGHVRVVTLKHKGGTCTRPVTKICVLPIDIQN